MQTSQASLRWRWGIMAALVVTLLTMLPQLNQWRLRGRDWHGSFYTYHPDEAPYAAYLNSLIEGRTRRNDPYTGRQDTGDAPLPESIFSIQFVPAYTLSCAARLFGFSASTIFILLAPLSAFAAALSIFWLAGMVTNDSRAAAISALAVLCLGGLARGQFLVRIFGGLATHYIPFPFLRRYEPAFPFPFFFLMCALVWLALSTKSQRLALLSTMSAALTFALLVYSYFHLWTAAAAWLACLFALWLLARPEGYRRDLKYFLLLDVSALVALVPYAYLLSHRAQAMDSYQALAFSHAPDLRRPPELLGLLLLILLAVCARRKAIELQERAVLFTASFALLPFVLFNQQILTGRSLQPIHYEQFIANYVAVLALVLTSWLILRRYIAHRPRMLSLNVVLACVAVLCLARGLAEVRYANRAMEYNNARDEGWPVSERLAELGRLATFNNQASPQVVLFQAPRRQIWAYKYEADNLPIVAPQPVLWALHLNSFSTLNAAEHKERFFQDFYYSGIDAERIEADKILKTFFQHIIFGWERAAEGLSVNWQPITEAEEQAALRDYTAFTRSFNRESATHPTLAYVVAPVNQDVDFTNLDRWYERDAGERVGGYMLYRVRLRP